MKFASSMMLVCAFGAAGQAGATAPGQAAATPQPPAVAAERALVVVVDASGSMKEAVEGGLKHDLARRGLMKTLATLPDDSQVSLRLLGKGGDGECRASEQIIPFAPFDERRWDSTLAGIEWDGTTPLTYSLLQAFDDLAAVDARRKEVLLVSDGEELCGEDPVATARAEHHGIRVHTLSLGRGGSHQLAGIALVTGGTYFTAYDDESFAAATAESLPAVPAGGVPAGAGMGGVLHVILDVSNSMWGQVDGRVKMELAREALAGALAELSPDVSVGLRAYGHRTFHEDKEASCRDTELLLEPAPGGAGAVMAAASSLRPNGQTPIALSLEAAAADLEAAGGQGVLLLLSDGIESCGGDPIAVAERLRSGGAQVVVHTVGLGVDAPAAEALAALARAGGGQYFDAPTADQLISGVSGAVRSSSEFILRREDPNAFPSPIERVAGSPDGAGAEVIGPGFYSLQEHLTDNDWRYFAVAGVPGSEVEVAALVCMLQLSINRAGRVSIGGEPQMLYIQEVDAGGELVRGGARLRVRGEMGDWLRMTVPVGDDGHARFRVGREFGDVHRDTLFSVTVRQVLSI